MEDQPKKGLWERYKDSKWLVLFGTVALAGAGVVVAMTIAEGEALGIAGINIAESFSDNHENT